MNFNIDTKEQEALIKNMDKRTDVEAGRMKRYLAMPDLSRTPGSPLYDETADDVRVLISGSHAAASLKINGTITGITN